MRFLIVDPGSRDRDAVVRLLNDAFAEAGLVLAGEVDAYQDSLAADPVDCVLTEHDLSWTDGLQVLRDVQARWPGVPVIMVTGSGSEQLAVDGFRAGLCDYVSKDRLSEELIPAIRRALERVQAEEALRQREARRNRRAEESEAERAQLAALVAELRDAKVQVEVLARFPSENPNPVLRVRKDGILLYANEASSSVLAHWQCAVGEPVPEFWQGLVTRALSEEQPVSLDAEIQTRTFSFVAAPVVPAGYVNVYVDDITERKRARVQLRQTQIDLARAQRVGQIGSWRLDTRHNVLTWSREAYSIFGVRWGTPMTYDAFLALIHPEDREYVDAQWQAGLSGAPYEIEHRIVVNEQVKWVREKAYLEFDETGELRGGFGITQDITHHKQVEAERDRLLADVRHQQEFLERVLTASPVGIAVVRGPELRFELVNPAYQAIRGAPGIEMIGRTVAEVFPEIAGRSLLDAVYRTGQAASVHEERVEVGPDREATYWDVGYIPLYDDAGALTSVLIVAHDVTEKVRARHEIEVQRAQLAAVLEQLPSGVIIADVPSGRVLLHNAQVDTTWRHPLISAATGGDGSPYRGLHPDGRPYGPEEWPLARSIRTGEVVVQEEINIEGPDGTRSTVLANSTPVTDPEGRATSAVAVFWDITERKRAEEELHNHAAELEAANQANRLLLQEINHRVKNNLTAILGLIFVEQHRLTREAGPGAYAGIHTALDSLAERVRSLATAHSLLSANQWRPLRVDQLVKAVIRAVAPLLPEPSELVLEVTGAPAIVTPEQAHHLALVISELTTNALKYGHDEAGVHIRVDIELAHGEVRLVYRNSGPEYSAAVLAGNGHSVGLGIVEKLARHSLRGSWTLRNDGGPVTEIRFPAVQEWALDGFHLQPDSLL